MVSIKVRRKCIEIRPYELFGGIRPLDGSSVDKELQFMLYFFIVELLSLSNSWQILVQDGKHIGNLENFTIRLSISPLLNMWY